MYLSYNDKCICFLLSNLWTAFQSCYGGLTYPKLPIADDLDFLFKDDCLQLHWAAM